MYKEILFVFETFVCSFVCKDPCIYLNRFPLLKERLFVYSKDEVRNMNRGNKMWEGHRIILPQHRDLVMEQKQKVREFHYPELADDELEEISRLIEWSLAKGKSIILTYANKWGPKRIAGVVTRVDPIEKWLVIQGEEDKRMIPFAKIIGAEAEDGESVPTSKKRFIQTAGWMRLLTNPAEKPLGFLLPFWERFTGKTIMVAIQVVNVAGLGAVISHELRLSILLILEVGAGFVNAVPSWINLRSGFALGRVSQAIPS